MTAKQYLRQVRKAQLQIQRLTEEIEERRTAITSTAAPILGDRVQTSPSDHFAAAMAQLMDLDMRRAEEMLDYLILKDKISAQVRSIEPELYQTVLYKRYINAMSLRKIAEEEGYSYDWICHVHGDALIAFSKKFGPEMNTTY